MNQITLTLYGRPNCHLCDRLFELIQPHISQISEHHQIKVHKRNIDSDPALVDLYGQRIPVLTHGNQVVLEGRPSTEQVAHTFESFVTLP